MVGRISFRWLALPSFIRGHFFHSTHQVIDNQTGIITRSSFLGTHSGHFKVLILVLIAIIFLVSLYFTMDFKKQRIHRRMNLGAPAEHNLVSEYHYGVVIDCGSSGSRVYLYYWPPHNGNRDELLRIKQLRNQRGTPVRMKINPGISTYSTNPSNASEYLKPLLDFAVEHIPKSKHKETPLYILATAGMRLLSKDKQDAILNDLRSDISKQYSFHFTPTHAEIITGKQEENPNPLSTEKPTESPRKKTVGALDMGGASAQIAFEVPKSTFVPKDLLSDVNLGCDSHETIHNYRVYVATFLGFGSNAAHHRYIEYVLKNKTLTYDKSSDALLDPCLPLEYHEKGSYKGQAYHMIGTGDYIQCKNNIQPLLNASVYCKSKPCSFNGVYQPSIGKNDEQFYGFSEYWYSMHDVLRIGGQYDAVKMAKAAKGFCSTRWNVLRRRHTQGLYPFADNHRLKYQCFKSAWMTTMLHEGFKFPASYHGLKSAQFIENKEVQWTLGAILYLTRFLPLREIQHNHLHSQYASSKSSYHFLMSYVSEMEFRVVFVICSVVVFAAIVLFFRRLRRMHRSSTYLSLWTQSPKSAVYSMELIPNEEQIPV
ncbi:ectonucleoside triphosphate diphosphohydrolase 4 isoform X2 [Exaiptasia diaphana]|uniref:Apyrase n=1 Tax=Exaiptasia diaphana TaxID=2652724 RepID=A0A913WSD0_EXADI|nr:ectonucleoside triphosphate diphosphohydrolase 4 isoform X2 [Exaiptasia diaphana]